MKLLQNKTRVNAPTSAYPFGSLIDETGSNNGTLVDVTFMNDMVQLNEKMFNESGITANGLPDNETNGFQLWEALVHAIRNQQKQKRFYVNISQSGTDAPTIQESFENDLGITPTIARTGTGVYTLTFSPTPFVTLRKVRRSIVNVGDETNLGTAYVKVTLLGVVTIYTFDSSGSASDDMLSAAFLNLDIYP